MLAGVKKGDKVFRFFIVPYGGIYFSIQHCCHGAYAVAFSLNALISHCGRLQF
jgi:hypothetical protein